MYAIKPVAEMFTKGKPIQPHLLCPRESGISIYSPIPCSVYIRLSQLVRNVGSEVHMALRFSN
jgi:hypothetical protein